jgi:hypothetical protein
MAAPSTTTAAGEQLSMNTAPSVTAPEPAPKKKGRTNTPWTAEEEQRLKAMRDAGNSWSEIAKVRGTTLPWQLAFTYHVAICGIDISHQNRGQCEEALVQG